MDLIEARPILEKRYRVQIDLYTKAIEQIYKRPVIERYLFFFDGAHILKLERIIIKNGKEILFFPTVFLIISNVWLID